MRTLAVANFVLPAVLPPRRGRHTLSPRCLDCRLAAAERAGTTPAFTFHCLRCGRPGETTDRTARVCARRCRAALRNGLPVGDGDFPTQLENRRMSEILRAWEAALGVARQDW